MGALGFLVGEAVYAVGDGREMICMNKHKNTRKIERFGPLARNTLRPHFGCIALIKYEGYEF
jgi:hypothetical protein